VVSFDDLKAMGKAKPAEAVPPSPDDYTTIMYTSGTTGGQLWLWGCSSLMVVRQRGFGATVQSLTAFSHYMHL
jgi:hypothetical protein